MTLLQATFLRERPYLAVAMTHFFVDVLNNGRTLLVALLAISIGLSNAQVGIALLLYNVSSALSQPIFGLLADRFGPRWWVVGGMGWMIFFYSLAAVAGDWLALLAVTVAGLGSGAFHPTGTMVASQISTDRRTQATAVFFMAGQIGLFAGPVLAGLFLQAYGRPGYLALPLLSMIAFVSGWQWLHNDLPPVQPYAASTPVEKTPAPGARPKLQWRLIVPLLAIIITINTVSIGAINFVPKLFTELGLAPAYVGWTAGLLMLGSAMGGLLGGTIGDRINGRWAILIGALGAVAPLYFYIPAADPWRLIWLLLAGLFIGMPHSVLVIQAQALLPGRRGLASGLTLGVMFFSGAIGAYILGLVADRIGLGLALQWTAVLPLLAALAALILPAEE
jgi:MFS transporter, FSR family, fosmidomycin resistance protein